ncbi:DUF6297 family protein [Amycolatopsis sp. PS_44_ISF1]|uniref:DUF6297 family protein n=1 Tax=Amycolatopsis sp. PS_44_ISF1 TaxID=2974917 RepID=UPI0028DDDE2E|nr:DUF6297 family protein [Amycolatopsis sp. PS_44_ISF1]MDT8910535.1 hypothetical protein [Amycolatopsis sp. PS_44_ISF1]
MVSLGVRQRVPGRKRFGGVFSGDSATFILMFGGGFLFTAFFRTASWHRVLFGPSPVDYSAVLGLVLLCCAVGWRSLLRRGFVWAEPAELTWMDFARVDRRRVVAARFAGALTGFVVVVAYLAALMLAVGGGGPALWRAGFALIVGSAVLVFATARRTAVRVDAAGPLVLAVAGFAIAAARLGPSPVLYVGGAVLLGAAALAFGGGPVTRAGRAMLLEGWNARVLRSVAVTFLDPMMMLPESAPVGSWSLRHPSALRLAWAGVVGRSRYLGALLLVALAVAVGHVAVPTLPGAVLVGLGAYVALTPFGAGLGVLWRNPGRRRWLGSSDRELVVAHGVALVAVAAGWSALLGVGLLALGTSVPGRAWVMVPVAGLAVLRTVTRKPVDYSSAGFVDTPAGPLPANLARQLFRGPDLLAAGILVLSLIG